MNTPYAVEAGLDMHLFFPKVSIEYCFILILLVLFQIGTFDFSPKISYYSLKEVDRIPGKKRRITLNDFEHRLFINILVDDRNKLLEVNKPT